MWGSEGRVNIKYVIHKQRPSCFNLCGQFLKYSFLCLYRILMGLKTVQIKWLNCNNSAGIELFSNLLTAIWCLNCDIKMLKPVKRVSPITLLIYIYLNKIFSLIMMVMALWCNYFGIFLYYKEIYKYLSSYSCYNSLLIVVFEYLYYDMFYI